VYLSRNKCSNKILKLKNTGNCSYLKIGGYNTISKLENIGDYSYLKIRSKDTVLTSENNYYYNCDYPE